MKIFFLLLTCNLFGSSIIGCAKGNLNEFQGNAFLKEALGSEEQKKWTILFYAAGCNSSEETLMTDLYELKMGLTNNISVNMIVLVDRIHGFSNDAEVFGENFVDTRLYQMNNYGVKRLNGNEFFPKITTDSKVDLNMGDAETLKLFIDYGKKYFPAEFYGLFVYSHGDGISFCADHESDRDALYPAEITEVLGSEQSVNLMALDVCSMGGIEIAYQWRPGTSRFSTDFLIASAPISAPWNYTAIFSRWTEIENEEQRNHTTGERITLMTPTKLGEMMMKEIQISQPWCSWVMMDLKWANLVKDRLDVLIRAADPNQLKSALAHVQLSGIHYIPKVDTQNKSYYRMRIPYYDLYHLVKSIQPSGNESKLIENTLSVIDSLVISSFYGQDGSFLDPALDFKDGRNGVYIFLPFGDEVYPYSGKRHWEEQTFYSPLRVRASDAFGQLDWCRGNAIPGNDKPENWFELLDFIFDYDQDSNNYKY